MSFSHHYPIFFSLSSLSVSILLSVNLQLHVPELGSFLTWHAGCLPLHTKPYWWNIQAHENGTTWRLITLHTLASEKPEAIHIGSRCKVCTIWRGVQMSSYPLTALSRARGRTLTELSYWVTFEVWDLCPEGCWFEIQEGPCAYKIFVTAQWNLSWVHVADWVYIQSIC